MSAEAFGAQLPADLTLDDLAAMALADEHGHRYEMSPEGVLSVMPPAGVDHAIIATRLLAWFLAAGWAADRVLQNCGIRMAIGNQSGGRVPDVSIWAKAPQTGQVWAPVDGLLLAIEIVSPASEAIDHVIKKGEYAKAAVPRYWIVDRDAANMVTMWTLTDAGYEMARPSPQPLAWLLNTSPGEHLG